MQQVISISKARRNLSKLIKRAQNGEFFYICVRDRAHAKLQAIARSHRFGYGRISPSLTKKNQNG